MREAANFLLGAVRSGQSVLVLCHHNADPDAVASSVVLAEVLTQLGGRARAGAADDISSFAQSILKAFGREVAVNPLLDQDIVVMVDTSSFGHLGEFGKKLKESGKKIAVIDHHRPVEEMKNAAEFYLVRDDFPSESELVLKLVQELGAKPSPAQASLLLAGIISDTAHFRLAKPGTFTAINSLLEAGAEYEKVMELMRQPDDPSKRVAMLKAAGRSELHRINGNLVVFSELGSFEGDAASMFVRIGADLALVGSEEKGKVRLSGRARPELIERTRIHLGEMMEEVGKQFNGSGGGHPGAASANGEGKLGEVKKHFLKLLQQKLNPRE
ncbi:MAG: DHH family phosphoesterase [Candidatus Hadarchaeota archaeon]